jgi:hypothetical protein
VGAMAGMVADRVEAEAAMRGLPSLPPAYLGPSVGSPSSPALSPVAILSSTLSAPTNSSTGGFVATSYQAIYAMAAPSAPPSSLSLGAGGSGTGAQMRTTCGSAVKARLPAPLLLPLPTPDADEPSVCVPTPHHPFP